MDGWARRGRRVTEEQLRRFERQIGFTLPEAYRGFLLEINGGEIAPRRAFTMRRHRRLAESTLATLHSLDDPDDARDLASQQRFPRPDDPPYGLRIGSDEAGRAVSLIMSGQRRGEVWMRMAVDPPEEPSCADWYQRRDAWKLGESFGSFMARLRPA
jgi:hypothetical protein